MNNGSLYGNNNSNSNNNNGRNINTNSNGTVFCRHHRRAPIAVCLLILLWVVISAGCQQWVFDLLLLPSTETETETGTEPTTTSEETREERTIVGTVVNRNVSSSSSSAAAIQRSYVVDNRTASASAGSPSFTLSTFIRQPQQFWYGSNNDDDNNNHTNLRPHRVGPRSDSEFSKFQSSQIYSPSVSATTTSSVSVSSGLRLAFLGGGQWYQYQQMKQVLTEMQSNDTKDRNSNNSVDEYIDETTNNRYCVFSRGNHLLLFLSNRWNPTADGSLTSIFFSNLTTMTTNIWNATTTTTTNNSIWSIQNLLQHRIQPPITHLLVNERDFSILSHEADEEEPSNSTSLIILLETNNMTSEVCRETAANIRCTDTGSWAQHLLPQDAELNQILNQQILSKLHQTMDNSATAFTAGENNSSAGSERQQPRATTMTTLLNTTTVMKTGANSTQTTPAQQQQQQQQTATTQVNISAVDVNSDPRPKHLRLAFLGDSLSRYQYVSLAYFLQHGRWWDKNKHRPYHLVNEQTYRGYDNMYRIQTTDERFLFPNEKCDCYREEGYIDFTVPNVTENRYFHEPHRDNMLVYIQVFGHAHPAHGRILPELAMDNITGFRYRHYFDHHTTPYLWESSDWSWVVRHHVARLRPKITHLVLNAGYWEHEFGKNETARVELKRALEETGIRGIWKTTTYRFPDGIHHEFNATDPVMCRLLDGVCLDLTWSNCVRTKAMFDGVHFNEPIYRIFNEDLLEGVMKIPFPQGYQRESKEENMRREMKYCWVLPGGSVFNATPNRIDPLVFD